jgi:NAD+-dependent secondary alcohol dehydrogenase Adh1
MVYEARKDNRKQNITARGDAMKAARLHAFDETLTREQLLQLEELPQPQIQEPDDVIVRVGGAGLCRTDLHIVEGIWRTKVDRPLPYILGHENAGWVHEVGTSVRTVTPGDPVIVHPLVTDGTCPACRRGEDMHCQKSWFPGISHNGGFAQFLHTKERSLLKLPANLAPKTVAPYADAGLTAYRAARKATEILTPGMTAAILGFGGLGHIAAQVLRSLCAGTIIIVDTSEQALQLAADMGFHHRVVGGRGAVDDVRRLIDGGADAVIDFVGEKGTPEQGMAMLRRGGTYYVVGYGGVVQVPAIDLIFSEFSVVGTLVGNYAELSALMTLAAQGQVHLTTREYRLDQVNDAMHDLIAGRLPGRGVLVP